MRVTYSIQGRETPPDALFSLPLVCDEIAAICAAVRRRVRAAAA